MLVVTLMKSKKGQMGSCHHGIDICTVTDDLICADLSKYRILCLIYLYGESAKRSFKLIIIEFSFGHQNTEVTASDPSIGTMTGEILDKIIGKSLKCHVGKFRTEYIVYGLKIPDTYVEQDILRTGV